jgi:DNA (cytosine-5)-methyltransferase 1
MFQSTWLSNRSGRPWDMSIRQPSCHLIRYDAPVKDDQLSGGQIGFDPDSSGSPMLSFPTIDLFAGAGGLGLGAMSAGGDVRLSVELDPVSCATLRSNPQFHPGRVLQADVTTISGSALRSEAGLGPLDPLLLIGGAPCQAFSKAAYWTEDGDEARYRRSRGFGLLAVKPEQSPRPPDGRRDLVWEFWRLVESAKPDAFLFENVPSILHPRNRSYIDGLLGRAEAAGYHCRLLRANAVDYGVPQRRQRIFLLASRRDLPEAPVPTHGSREPSSLNGFVTAGRALASVTPEAQLEPEEVVRGRWAQHLREIPPGWNYKHHTAWAGHPTPSFVAETRFWNFLLKLSPDLPSWTIAANPGPWVGPFHWDSRRLRTDELAALQAFPAGYRFHGTRRERVRQIGNAVPPPLAAAMVRALLQTVAGDSREAA